MFNDDEDYGFLTGGLGDLDGDGSLTAAEALRILHYVSGKVNSVAM